MTLAFALDFIASEIESTSLDCFLEAEHQECKYICDTLQLTPLQVALFATILEKSGDDLANTKDLVSTLKVSKIRFLGFKPEIDELAKKRLVVARQRRNGSMGYRVSQSVVKAIQNNSAIEPEKMDGLTTRNIFNRLHNIFADIANGVNSSDIALQEICDIMNNNPENRFVETSMRLGINGLGSSAETIIMFYMLHRIVSFNDNEFTIDEISRLFDDPMESMISCMKQCARVKAHFRAADSLSFIARMALRIGRLFRFHRLFRMNCLSTCLEKEHRRRSTSLRMS